jgi:hypothetical protein
MYAEYAADMAPGAATEQYHTDWQSSAANKTACTIIHYQPMDGNVLGHERGVP